MALIKCSECGQEISDKASECINCGCPIKQDNNKKAKLRKKESSIAIVLKTVLFSLGPIVLICIIYLIYIYFIK